MKSKYKKFLDFFRLFTKLSSNRQIEEIKNLDNSHANAIIGVCLDFCKKRDLKVKYKSKILKLKSKRATLPQKRKNILEGRGIISTILGIALPTIIGALARKRKTRK